MLSNAFLYLWAKKIECKSGGFHVKGVVVYKRLGSCLHNVTG